VPPCVVGHEHLHHALAPPSRPGGEDSIDRESTKRVKEIATHAESAIAGRQAGVDEHRSYDPGDRGRDDRQDAPRAAVTDDDEIVSRHLRGSCRACERERITRQRCAPEVREHSPVTS
jgi:hypothetical protein